MPTDAKDLFAPSIAHQAEKDDMNRRLRPFKILDQRWPNLFFIRERDELIIAGRDKIKSEILLVDRLVTSHPGL